MSNIDNKNHLSKKKLSLLDTNIPFINFFRGKSAFLLFLIPPISFVLYYINQFFYNLYFKIPFEFIKLDSITYLIIMSRLVFFIILYHFIHKLIFRFLQGNNMLYARRLKYNTIYISQLIFWIVYLRTDLFFFPPMVFVIVLALILRKFFHVPMSIIKEQGTRNPFKIVVSRTTSDLLDKLDHEHFWYAVLSSIIYIIILTGYFDASLQNKFHTISQDNERYVVINKYNDKLFCYKINESNMITSSKYFLKDLNDVNLCSLKKESYGYLTYIRKSIIFSEIPTFGFLKK